MGSTFGLSCSGVGDDILGFFEEESEEEDEEEEDDEEEHPRVRERARGVLAVFFPHPSFAQRSRPHCLHFPHCERTIVREGVSMRARSSIGLNRTSDKFDHGRRPCKMALHTQKTNTNMFESSDGQETKETMATTNGTSESARKQ